MRIRTPSTIIRMHAKVFSIEIFQHFHQIPPRVCTLVLFINPRYACAERVIVVVVCVCMYVCVCMCDHS